MSEKNVLKKPQGVYISKWYLFSNLEVLFFFGKCKKKVAFGWSKKTLTAIPFVNTFSPDIFIRENKKKKSPFCDHDARVDDASFDIINVI